jgi:hypothetical protein
LAQRLGVGVERLEEVVVVVGHLVQAHADNLLAADGRCGEGGNGRGKHGEAEKGKQHGDGVVFFFLVLFANDLSGGS